MLGMEKETNCILKTERHRANDRLGEGFSGFGNVSFKEEQSF